MCVCAHACQLQSFDCLLDKGGGGCGGSQQWRSKNVSGTGQAVLHLCESVRSESISLSFLIFCKLIVWLWTNHWNRGLIACVCLEKQWQRFMPCLNRLYSAIRWDFVSWSIKVVCSKGFSSYKSSSEHCYALCLCINAAQSVLLSLTFSALFIVSLKYPRNCKVNNLKYEIGVILFINFSTIASL